VFVHGCFWHRHTGCKLTRTPKTRIELWTSKLDGNKVRDERVQEQLEKLGWEIMVVWECEIDKSDILEEKLLKYLTATRNM
jgi:DNA mismatch endonuclease (patch repair protein)